MSQVIFTRDSEWSSLSPILRTRCFNEVTSGRQPHTAFRTFRERVSAAELVPDGFRVVSTHLDGPSEDPDLMLLAVGDDAQVILQHARVGILGLITATSRDRVAELVVELEQRHRELAQSPLDKVPVRVWTGRGPTVRSTVRDLDYARWVDAAENYPTNVRERLEPLVALNVPKGTGRLVLWHGPPGTGKTSAVLSLADAWRSWAEFAVVTNAEQLFEDTDYLERVLVDGKGSSDRWQVIVGEDADDYLRRDARARSGPALGRLLNVTDGILGRGTKTIVLLTSNDDIGHLQPAFARTLRSR